jgi:uncharacterized protein
MKLSSLIILLIIAHFVKAQEPSSDTIFNQKLKEARQYLTGVGKLKDRAKAAGIYLQCATEGSIRAMNVIGYFYSEGVGVEKNYSKAIEWLSKAANAGYGESYYHLGVLYKEGRGFPQNFSKAYDYFNKAAELNNDLGTYALGYMHFKGLGCEQNYSRACALFSEAALAGNTRSMYLLGICFRNGYGTAANQDSALKWLAQASKKGYMPATQELRTKLPESGDVTSMYASERIKLETESLLAKNVNRYQQVDLNLSQDILQGTFEGTMVKYDWSGQVAIATSRLSLEISGTDSKLSGRWIENDSVNIPFKGSITASSLVFEDAKYSRTDHYSNQKRIPFLLRNARLSWVRTNDTIYLIGNIQMVSEITREPEKPISILLKKSVSKETLITSKNILTEHLKARDEPGLRVFPNPFSNTLTVEFYLPKSSNVTTQVLDVDGKLIYNNQAESLTPGHYVLPIKLQKIPAGNYMVKISIGNQVKTIQVVRQ